MKPSSANPDSRERSYEGRIVGVTREIDLAVIKIQAHGLPALSIGSSVSARQGEMVFAFGSPEGLRNTVTMGVVSSVARQPDPDSPFVYVQTDTRWLDTQDGHQDVRSPGSPSTPLAPGVWPSPVVPQLSSSYQTAIQIP